MRPTAKTGHNLGSEKGSPRQDRSHPKRGQFLPLPGWKNYGERSTIRLQVPAPRRQRGTAAQASENRIWRQLEVARLRQATVT